nr:MAG TPA: hypothetical protein [Caudoviricetes sp.]
MSCHIFTSFPLYIRCKICTILYCTQLSLTFARFYKALMPIFCL